MNSTEVRFYDVLLIYQDGGVLKRKLKIDTTLGTPQPVVNEEYLKEKRDLDNKYTKRMIAEIRLLD